LHRKLLAFLFLAVATTVSASPTTPCSAGTLSSYESTYSAPLGCSIGILDYSGFTYHPVSNAPLASAITLTPETGGFSFTQTNGLPFTASAGEIVQFEIDYNIIIDPAPILAGADNSIDPPTGNVTVTEFFCNDSQYVYSGSCLTGFLANPVQTLSVGTIPPLTLSAAITFSTPATAFQGVGVLFTLNGTNGPSTFDGASADSVVIGDVPEPAACFLAGLGLLAGSYTLRKRKR
jgi:hypothetical protein